jgi:hypothetical protein
MTRYRPCKTDESGDHPEVELSTDISGAYLVYHSFYYIAKRLSGGSGTFFDLVTTSIDLAFIISIICYLLYRVSPY